MIKKQHQYLEYIDAISSEIKKLDRSNDILNRFKLVELKKAIAGTQLTIPVIGGYSAGKSTLLNSLLNKEYLPVGITPETALASELHYSENEYIEAIKSNNSVDKYAITDIDLIKAKASEYKFLKMFINNKNLQVLKPLILVDMPGFDSPLDLHNKAIVEYLNKGVHYITLTSIEDGTLTRTMARQINEIQEFGRSFSFLLGKTNLKSELEVNEIRKELVEQLDEYCDIEANVILVNDNGGDSLQKILSNISIDDLFEDIFIAEIKSKYTSISDYINTSISAFSNNKTLNESAISDLQASYSDLINERDNMIKKAKERYSQNQVGLIVEAVGRDLTNSSDELVNVVISKGSEALSPHISEIVRHALIVNIKASLNQISDDVIEDISANLSILNKSISDFSMSDDWLKKITNTTKNLLKDAQRGLNDVVTDRSKRVETDNLYKTITTILALTTTVLNPILELVVVFLPNLLSGLLNKLTRNKQAERVNNVLLTQIVPSIKREVRSQLPTIFNEQVKNLITSISKEFEAAIEEKENVIAKSQHEIESKIIDINKTISLYKDVNNSIDKLTTNALFKG